MKYQGSAWEPENHLTDLQAAALETGYNQPRFKQIQMS